MAKKRLKSEKSTNILDKLPNDKKELLKLEIAHSEAMIGPNSTKLDAFFRGQAERQRKRLEEL